MLLRDFSAKVGKKDVSKLIIDNENLHEISSYDGFGAVNLPTSKNLSVKSTMFPHRNIHKYTWMSPDGKIHNQIDHILIGRHSSVLHVRSFRAADCDTDHDLVVAKFRERPEVNKQRSHIFHMEGFNLMTLKEVERKGEYRVEITNRFVAFERF
jgi:hypothetical protein